MAQMPMPLLQRLHADFVDRLEVYGLNRLTALNAAGENNFILPQAYQAGIADGEGTETVLRTLDALIEEHCQRRSGDTTYDTARAVLTDLRADLAKALTP